MAVKAVQRFWVAGAVAMLAAWLGSCDAVPEPMDLRTFEKPDVANHFLVCDPAFCRATPDMPSPNFWQSAERIGKALHTILREEPRLFPVSEDDAAGRWLYVQRSALFRFPDAIWVQIMSRPEGGSTLALYSRSLYGRYDFGVNEARLRRWLLAMEYELGQAGRANR